MVYVWFVSGLYMARIYGMDIYMTCGRKSQASAVSARYIRISISNILLLFANIEK